MKKMYVLGIETSCDETAAAVVKSGKTILSNEYSSSLRFHRKYGGVIPEIASRKQLETITEVTQSAIKESRVKLSDINLISVTSHPGLFGSLLVGISFAKSLSLGLNIPLLGVDHLYGHIYANFLQTRIPQKTRRQNRNSSYPALPAVGLVISGGHTSLFHIQDFDMISPLGATLDDACGEAFDKVAKILGLGYPGGPVIERIAIKGNPGKIRFNCSDTNNPLDFSFSGIKTAVLYYLRDHATKNTITQCADITASFQDAIINTLIKKAFLACKITRTKNLLIGGGVAANAKLREKFSQAAKNNKICVFFPAKELCMDNAAMIAGLGFRLFNKGYRGGLETESARS